MAEQVSEDVLRERGLAVLDRELGPVQALRFGHSSVGNRSTINAGGKLTLKESAGVTFCPGPGTSNRC